MTVKIKNGLLSSLIRFLISAFCVILFLTKPVTAQKYTLPCKGIELKCHYAVLMTHHKHMNILREQHYPIYQLNFIMAGDHGKEWQSLYKYPTYGVSLMYSPLSSPQYIGFGAGVLPFINFPMFRANDFSANFFLGTGLGYIEKPFDIRNNFKNQAIGSHLNALLAGQFDFRFRISQTSEISAGLSITHFSNGKIKIPNLGINNVGVFAGYSLYFADQTFQKKPETTKPEKKWEKNIFLALAIKQNYPVGGKYYPYTALSFNGKRIISHKRKIGAGVDLVYDFSDKAHFESLGVHNNDLTYFKPTIYALHDFRLGKMSIFLHLGTYLYAYEKNKNGEMIFDRIGLQYYFNDSFSALVALKTHYAKADCIEWALNYSF